MPAAYTLIVLAGVLIVKELLFRHVARLGDSIGSPGSSERRLAPQKRRHHVSFRVYGVSIALLGEKVWKPADRWAALGAAFVILYNAWRQLRPAILESMPQKHVYSDWRTK